MKALIWDMDGTLIDTQIEHARLEHEWLLSKGIALSTTQIIAQFAGHSPFEWIPSIMRANNMSVTHDELDAFVQKKRASVRAIMEEAREDLLVPGMKEMIEWASGHGYVQAIASGAHSSLIEAFLRSYHLHDYFPVAISAYDVPKPKPAPDVFLSALSGLQQLLNDTTIEEFWVIGDGRADIIGGQAAGAQTFWLAPDSEILEEGITCTIQGATLADFMGVLQDKTL